MVNVFFFLFSKYKDEVTAQFLGILIVLLNLKVYLKLWDIK
jgi:hypothetical protein